MEQSEQNDILMLLTVGVFADKRIHSSEVMVFMKSVSRMKLSKHDIPHISEAQALAWFEMNKDHVRHIFTVPTAEFEAWLIPILERLAAHVDKEALTHLLNMIFLADHEIHISEIALMTLIKRVWNLD